MKLGLVADIHEHVGNLRTALDEFVRARVDQVVVLGDLTRVGEQLEPTCQLLQEVAAIGVWGNHDLGLCRDPEPDMVARFPRVVLDFMATLRPKLSLGDCHYSHVEPWLDPTDPTQINYFEGPPDESHKLARIFAAARERWLFTGHYHRWMTATPAAISDWTGRAPVHLAPGRHFVVIGAICAGRFATFDTDSAELTPYEIS